MAKGYFPRPAVMDTPPPLPREMCWKVHPLCKWHVGHWAAGLSPAARRPPARVHRTEGQCPGAAFLAGLAARPCPSAGQAGPVQQHLLAALRSSLHTRDL